MPTLETGQKYLVLQIGNTKLPFFPAQTKDNKKYYRCTLSIWVNEKREQSPTIQTEEVL